MDRLSFIKQYFTKPQTVGAILPSSNHLADKMVETIDFKSASHIMEYGPGTGAFTDKILKRRKSDTIILLFECNEVFYSLLQEKYKKELNLYIINDSAEHIEKYMARYHIPWVDYIVSGLPFTSLPQTVSANILKQTKLHLRQDGRFILFQYTLFKKKLIEQYFNNIAITRELRNMPPAYVFSCSNRRIGSGADAANSDNVGK